MKNTALAKKLVRKKPSINEVRSETGDGVLFARRYQEVLRYDESAESWMLFDGNLWKVQARGKVMRMAKKLIRRCVRKALSDENDAALKWYTKGLERRRLANMVFLAQSELLMADDGQSWDADLNLVGTPNGTLDLRTGTVMRAEPNDRITKRLGAEWNPEAQSDLWENVLERALPDPQVRAFLQQMAGLSLAGLVGENILPMIYGVPRSSKGTVLDAITGSFGDYARAASLTTVVSRKFEDGGTPRPDLVALRGARMVSVYEAGRSLKLDTALLKSLSGSDPITARTLHAKPITFYPSFIIWIASDKRPEAPSEDSGFFERLCTVPFDVALKPEERDPDVRARLKLPEHASAILAWAYQGLVAYRKAKRLVRPAKVAAANAEYQDAMAYQREFFDDVLLFEPGQSCTTQELRYAYTKWCESEGEKALPGGKLGELLRARGAAPGRTFQGRIWSGVTLRKAPKQESEY